jgi:hypothetical protein
VRVFVRTCVCVCVCVCVNACVCRCKRERDHRWCTVCMVSPGHRAGIKGTEHGRGGALRNTLHEDTSELVAVGGLGGGGRWGASMCVYVGV